MRQMQKASVLGVGIFSLAFVIFFGLGFESESNSGISLDELEQNQYTVTPTTIPLTVTTDTISPLTEKLTSDTQSVTPKITEQNNYPGAGLVFPLLQQAFGIGSTVTSLNFNDWDMGGNFRSEVIRMDTSGGANNGNLYVGSFDAPIIHRLDPTTNQLTKWTAPLGSYRAEAVVVDDAGLVYFVASHVTSSSTNNLFIGLLNPVNDEITLWDLGFGNESKAIAIDNTNNVLWVFSIIGDNEFVSLDVDTDELKRWNVESICNSPGGLAFAGGVFRAADGLVYATSNQRQNLCTLNPTTNVVTEYDTNLVFNNSQRPAIDSAGNIFALDSSTEQRILMINPTVPEAKHWDLTGANVFSWEIAVDLNDDPWFVSRAGSNGIGLVRIDVSTDVVTEWDLNTSAEFASHLTFPNDGKDDMWALLENNGSGTNDHFVQYCEGSCT